MNREQIILSSFLNGLEELVEHLRRETSSLTIDYQPQQVKPLFRSNIHYPTCNSCTHGQNNNGGNFRNNKPKIETNYNKNGKNLKKWSNDKNQKTNFSKNSKNNNDKKSLVKNNGIDKNVKKTNLNNTKQNPIENKPKTSYQNKLPKSKDNKKILKFDEKIGKFCDNWTEQKGNNYILKCNEGYKNVDHKTEPMEYLFSTFRYGKVEETEFNNIVKPLSAKVSNLFNVAICHHRLNYGVITNVMSRTDNKLFSNDTKIKINSYAEKCMREDLDKQLGDSLLDIIKSANGNDHNLLLAIKLAVDRANKQKRIKIWRQHPMIRTFVETAFEANGIPKREFFEEDSDNNNNKKIITLKNEIPKDEIEINPRWSQILNIVENNPLFYSPKKAPQLDIKIESDKVVDKINVIETPKIMEVEIVKSNKTSPMKKPLEIKSEPEIYIDMESEFPPLKCTMCGVTMDKGVSYMAHLKRCAKKIHWNGSYDCPECSEVFDKDETDKFIEHHLMHQNFRVAPDLQKRC